MAETDMIRTPDQPVRVFVSSTLRELAAERDAVTSLRLVPVMFGMGAQPYPLRRHSSPHPGLQLHRHHRRPLPGQGSQLSPIMGTDPAGADRQCQGLHQLGLVRSTAAGLRRHVARCDRLELFKQTSEMPDGARGIAGVAETTMRNAGTSAVGSASPCHGMDRPVGTVQAALTCSRHHNGLDQEPR
jgi:hypothetical protein